MSLHREHTARRRYRCDWGCGDPIEPGTRYVYSALPPGAEPLCAEGWTVQRLHGDTFYDCPGVSLTEPPVVLPSD